MNRPQYIAQKNGFILIATYLVVALITLLAFAFFARGTIFQQAAERNQNKIVAFHMAEAAVDEALVQLASNISYAGTNQYVPMNTSNVRGGYTVTVSTAPNDLTTRTIQATGFAPDNVPSSRAYQRVALTVYARYELNSLFNFAIFANNSIALTSSGKVASVDSYDSSKGPYGGDNKGSNGDIGTNSINQKAITLAGNTAVYGDALIGPSGDTDTAVSIGPNSTLYGTSSASQELLIFPVPTTDLPSSGDLNITTDTTYLEGGTYHFDSLKISGTGQLALTGTTVIYVNGDVSITGNGIVTQNNIPKNLLIYSTGTNDVAIGGNGSFYGGIYAPLANVKNDGNGGVHGAIVSKTYTQTGNASIHFDEAMKDIVGNTQNPKPSVVSWQEQNSLTWGT